MNKLTGEVEGPEECGAVPDVTQIPLLSLAARSDRVLDRILREVVEDVVRQKEISAGFGNIA